MFYPVIQLIEYWDVKTERIRLANALYKYWILCISAKYRESGIIKDML